MSFPGFKIEKKAAAQGGMAVIHKAIREKDGSLCAIKVLQDETPKEIDHFYREATLTAACRNPHIIKIFSEDHSSPQKEGPHYIVLEWLDAVELGRHVLDQKIKRLSVRKAIDFTDKLLDALSSVHRAGILHCDIRPQNVLINEETNTLKLIDFGIARKGVEVGKMNFGIAGGNLFISPEHGQPETLCKASDIFCVALMLYFMLTGSFPYPRSGKKTTASMSQLMRSETAQPIREKLEHIPHALEAVIMRALAPHPEDRYASAKQFQTALRHIELNLPTEEADSAPAAKDLLSKSALDINYKHATIWLASTAILLLLLMLGSISMLYAQRNRTEYIATTPVHSPPSSRNARAQPLEPQRPFIPQTQEAVTAQAAFYETFNQIMAQLSQHLDEEAYIDAKQSASKAILLRSNYQQKIPDDPLSPAILNDPEHLAEMIDTLQRLTAIRQHVKESHRLRTLRQALEQLRDEETIIATSFPHAPRVQNHYNAITSALLEAYLNQLDREVERTHASPTTGRSSIWDEQKLLAKLDEFNLITASLYRSRNHDQLIKRRLSNIKQQLLRAPASND